MTFAARLITPQGQTILLSPKMYEAILKILEERESPPAFTPSALVSLLEEIQGKYAGHPSMVRALLTERQAEREKEKSGWPSRKGEDGR